MTLTVTAVNDTPTVTVAAGGCGRDDHSGTINHGRGRYREPDSGPDTQRPLSSSSPTLVPTGNIGFAGSSAAGLMTVSAVDGRSGTAT